MSNPFSNASLVDVVTKSFSNAMQCAKHVGELLGRDCSYLGGLSERLRDSGTSDVIDAALAFGTLSEAKENRNISATATYIWQRMTFQTGANPSSGKNAKKLFSGVKSLTKCVTVLVGKSVFPQSILHIPSVIAVALQGHTVWAACYGLYENPRDSSKQFYVFNQVALLILMVNMMFKFNAVHYIYNQVRKLPSLAGRLSFSEVSLTRANEVLPELSLKSADAIIDVLKFPGSLSFLSGFFKDVKSFSTSMPEDQENVVILSQGNIPNASRTTDLEDMGPFFLYRECDSSYIEIPVSSTPEEGKKVSTYTRIRIAVEEKRHAACEGFFKLTFPKGFFSCSLMLNEGPLTLYLKK